MTGARAAILIAASLIAAALGGCAGRPDGVLKPVAAAAPGTSRVDMLVATTRARATDAGVMFTGERGLKPSFAEIVVSIPPDAKRKAGDVQWPERLPGNAATDFVTLATTDLDREQAIKRFHQMVGATPHRRVLVFIHGFNNRFDDAVYRFAQITHDSGLDAVPVMFTWPSRGSVWAYGYDRESTNYSRDALEDLLRFLAKDPDVSEVAILAHSMGNWLTLEALRQMAIRDKRVHPKIKTLMLAAPDVDVDVFRRQIAEIGSTGPQTTLFVSQDDRALAVSRRVWGDIPRLGAINPTSEPYKTELADDKITVIDLTKLKTDDSLNHAKFASSPEVVRLIGQRLASGQTVTDARVGLGDRIAGVATGAAATVGSAAGLVLSAPIAVVDPNTRATLGERIGQVGANVTDAASGSGQ